MLNDMDTFKQLRQWEALDLDRNRSIDVNYVGLIILVNLLCFI